MKNGRRQDTFRTSLERAMERENLVVRKYSLVTKLIFRPGSKNEVAGVQYERHGKTYVAKARKETILCSGSLETPKILMLSGIGPKAHLEEMKV